ncbi:MAG: tRNA lysidine(34) synthetase TilS [Flavobacteriia bacterium]|jgi:tRNA(Ile)-lysidine synthase
MRDLKGTLNKMLGSDPMSRYFVACSGGVDSITLLFLLHSLKKKVSAIHVNYLLRGEESEKDQQLVEETCKQLGIPCHVKRVDLNRYLQEAGGNMQEQARKVRYSYFETFKVKRDHFIVLGHHADDQVETFFLNLARGGGMMGLSAMLPNHEQYLRPFLTFTKQEILDYARKHQLNWREDLSNAKNDYSRNKLRNVILPELEKGIPSLRQSVLTIVDAFQTTQQELEILTKDLVKKIEDERVLLIEEYKELGEFERIELLRQLDLAPSVTEELNKLTNAEKGKRIHLNDSRFQMIIRETDHFYFGEEEPMLILPSVVKIIVEQLPATYTKDEIYLDPKKIKGVLTVRTWRKGDRMKPVGLAGSKLVSDILTDAKVPHSVRSHQLVLTDDEKILWCVGFAIGREAIASKDSEILKVGLE